MRRRQAWTSAFSPAGMVAGNVTSARSRTSITKWGCRRAWSWAHWATTGANRPSLVLPTIIASWIVVSVMESPWMDVDLSTIKVKVNFMSSALRKSEGDLTIGALSRRSGVAASALRYYETRGLIASHRTDAGQRRYR